MVDIDWKVHGKFQPAFRLVAIDGMFKQGRTKGEIRQYCLAKLNFKRKPCTLHVGNLHCRTTEIRCRMLVFRSYAKASNILGSAVLGLILEDELQLEKASGKPESHVRKHHMNAFKVILIVSVLDVGLYSAVSLGGNSSISGNQEASSSLPSPQHPEAVSHLTRSEMEKIFVSKSAVIVYAMTGTDADKWMRIPRSVALSQTSGMDKISAAIPDKSTPIVIYSYHADDNSCTLVAKHLRDLGYRNVKIYHEGVQLWINTGNPAEE